MKAKDLLGKKFGRLTVIERAGSDKKRQALWLCKCECGNTKIIVGYALSKGLTKSCGCLNKEITKKMFTKHGMRHSRIYSLWLGIKDRCLNNKNSNWMHYGGRGITICKEWKNDFVSFYEWSIKNGYNDNLTIDRIDNNCNYEPNNCRWTTITVQANNKSTNHLIKYNNETDTMMNWCKRLNLSYTTIRARINILKWDDKRALETPIKHFARGKNG